MFRIDGHLFIVAFLQLLYRTDRTQQFNAGCVNVTKDDEEGEYSDIQIDYS